MKISKKTLSVITGILIILIIIIVIKLKSEDSSKRPLPKPAVVAGALIEGEMLKTEMLTGDILPDQQANIYSKVNGNIEKLYVDIGSKVAKNKILAIIDTTIYSQSARQAKANLMQADANLKNAKLNYDRNKKLVEQKMVSQQDLDNAKASLDVAVAQKQAAEAAYNNAVTQLNYCKVTAPFAGTITKRTYDQGTYVTASTSAQGSVLFTLMKTDKLKIDVNMPERSVPFLCEVKDIMITADAGPQRKFKGRISKISQAIDLSTRTMPIEIEITNPDGALKPGMFATIALITDKKVNALMVPNQVVQTDDKGSYVFTINNDTTVSKKYVKTGIAMDEKLEIISGVTKEDKIVFVGQTLVKDKMKVKLAK